MMKKILCLLFVGFFVLNQNQAQAQSTRSAIRDTSRTWDDAKKAYETDMTALYEARYEVSYFQSLSKDLNSQITKIDAEIQIDQDRIKNDSLSDKTLAVVNARIKSLNEKRDGLIQEKTQADASLTKAKDKANQSDETSIKATLNDAAEDANDNVNDAVGKGKNTKKGKRVLLETKRGTVTSAELNKLNADAAKDAQKRFVEQNPNAKLPTVNVTKMVIQSKEDPKNVLQNDVNQDAVNKENAKKQIEANTKLCKSYTDKDGGYAQVNGSYVCTIGDLQIGDELLKKLPEYKTEFKNQIPKDEFFKLYFSQTGKNCESDSDLNTVCQKIGSLYGYSEKDNTPFKYQNSSSSSNGSCGFEGSGDVASKPFISAKAFCAGPFDKNGKPTPLAAKLGVIAKDAPVTPSDTTECDKLYVELARLVMKDPKNKTILASMIASTTAKMAALVKGMPKQTVEEFANKQNDAIKAADTQDFQKQLNSLYLGANPESVNSVLKRLEAGTSNYFDPNLRKQYSNTTSRFKNDDSAAFILFLSQTKDYQGVFSTSDASAIWAQNRFYNEMKLQIGDDRANKMNFSSQVYAYNQTWNTAKKGDPKSLDEDVRSKIQSEMDQIFKSEDGKDPIVQAAKSGKCLKTDGGASCDAANTKLGAVSLDQIKRKIAESATRTEMEGLGKKYNIGNLRFNRDGSFAFDFTESAAK